MCNIYRRIMTTKSEIRQKIWDYLEKNNLANFPRPVHDRIPNFKGAGAAAQKLSGLKIFKESRVFKVNPDKPQEEVRFLILQNPHNTLLVPTPRLRHGLFNRITPPPGANKEILRKCATSQGVKLFSAPVGLEDRVKVDMIVIGSVAVSTTGLRIGKGEGFADLECAMMRSMGAVDDSTLVVTTVHDCQLTDIPEELYAPHDICVDVIVTPTQVLVVEPRRPKPPGVLWSFLTKEKFLQVPILKQLRANDASRGVDVHLKDEDGSGPAPMAEAAADAGDRTQRELLPSLAVTRIPDGVRVSEFKTAVRQLQTNPLRVNWNGQHGRAFLDFKDTEQMQDALKKLSELKLKETTVKVEISRRTKERLGL